MSSKDYDKPTSQIIYGQMLRCQVKTCARWWSSLAKLERCPCGGQLDPVDMKQHIATLPGSK